MQEETGGSYYIIRQIVQELMYNSKLASLNKGSVPGKTKEISQISYAKELPVSVGDEILKPDNEIEVSFSYLSRRILCRQLVYGWFFF